MLGARRLTQHGHFDMNDRVNSDTTTTRKILRPRRLALLGTVAALGVAVLALSPASSPFGVNSLISPAQAAESAATPPGFGDLVSKVKPAVISVRVKIDQDNDKSAMLQQNRMDSDEDSPFDQFSRQFGFRGQGGMNGMPRQRHQMITGDGSGFFISADGYAVTNNHVVDHAKSVQVTTDDGKTYTAKVIGTDPKTDLALIKVDGKNDFPFVNFADRQAARRRLGGRGRQSVRPRRHRDRRHRLGRGPRHRLRPL